MNLIHCSYHKCLTVYFARVMRLLYNRVPVGRPYHHFNSYLDGFYRSFSGCKVASVNNRTLDPSRLGDFRMSRFVRDPRDLVVSGYFYHRRGAELWTNVVGPTDADWEIVNGSVPSGLRNDESYAMLLQRLDLEDGLIAEIEFRSNHLASMLQWPSDDRIRVYRYEDVMGQEGRVFADILRFYGVTKAEELMGSLLARRLSAGKGLARTEHIRNPSSSQWKAHFTPRVAQYFDERYAGILERHGYSPT